MVLGIAWNSYPKFNVYLVSKTYLLISLRTSFNVFFVVTYFEMTGCWFISLVWLLTNDWVVVDLLGHPAQLLYNEPSLIVVGCFSTPLCCNCFIVSMKESRRCFSCYHSLAPLVLTGSLSLNTYYFDYWLRVVTVATTLIGTLSILDSSCVVVALELTCLVLDMFYTSIFLGHSVDLCYVLEQIIQG